MQSLLVRWAEEVGHRYELDDPQRGQLRDQVLKRWTPFLQEHKRRFQPLFNEFLEMRLGVEPPKKEQVQDWAERAAPLFDDVRKQLDEGASGFREILTPAQRIKFEFDFLGYQAGAKMAEAMLRQWQGGKYDEKEVWTPPGRRTVSNQNEAGQGMDKETGTNQKRSDQEAPFRTGSPGDRADQSREREGADATGEDQIALELDAWTSYIGRFIQLFELNDAQKGAVLSMLQELKSRATDHRDRHHEEIERLEQRIAHFSGGDKEMEELKKQLAELYGPVDEMFQELKKRIDNVPTEAQRAAAQEKSGERPQR